jgi:hypothetical protein
MTTSTPKEMDRIHMIFHDFIYEINPEKSCKPCLFSLCG